MTDEEKTALAKARKQMFTCREEPGMQAVQAFLKVKLEITKNQLLTSGDANYKELKGEALAYKRMIGYINQPSNGVDD